MVSYKIRLIVMPGGSSFITTTSKIADTLLWDTSHLPTMLIQKIQCHYTTALQAYQ